MLAEFNGQKRFKTFLIETLLDNCSFQFFNYQTNKRRSCGEIPATVSFRRPYRKGSTCSHPEHSSQAFRADDSAYQRESRYCRIFKALCCFGNKGLFSFPSWPWPDGYERSRQAAMTGSEKTWSSAVLSSGEFGRAEMAFWIPLADRLVVSLLIR